MTTAQTPPDGPDDEVAASVAGGGAAGAGLASKTAGGGAMATSSDGVIAAPGRRGRARAASTSIERNGSGAIDRTANTRDELAGAEASSPMTATMTPSRAQRGARRPDQTTP